MPQEPFALGRPDLDGDLLAAAHASQAGDFAPERRQLGGPRGPQGQQMCLLEEIPPTTG